VITPGPGCSKNAEVESACRAIPPSPPRRRESDPDRFCCKSQRVGVRGLQPVAFLALLKCWTFAHLH
jgi:hypothetical protein